MKNLTLILLRNVLLALCILCGIVLFACISNPEFKEINKKYGDKYELRKFNVKTSSTTESSGYFFIIVGGYDSKTKELTNAKMYFKNYIGQYEFLEIPLSKVLIRTDSLVTIPYITFDYTKDSFFNMIMNDSENRNYLPYMKIIIHCKESDFMPEININIADLK